MNTKILKAVEIASDAKLQSSLKVFEDIKEIANANEYKIAVVGEFKSGKSTFINNFFLGNNLLFTDVLEATAISTEVKYSKECMLKVYPFKKTQYEGTDYVVDIDEPSIIPNPSAETIMEYTAGKTQSDKIGIIKNTSHAELLFDNENLRGLTIIDTAGINSTTPEVLDGVKRCLKNADMILFVKKAKQFSNTELDFLCDDVFSVGLQRGAILINNDPSYAYLDEDDVDALKSTLKAQLNSIGRTHIPVKFIDFKNGEASELSFLYSDDTEEDLTKSAFAKELIDYLNSNKEIGRNIKIREYFASAVLSAVNEAKIELAALKLSPEELEAEKAKVLKNIDEFSVEVEQIADNFVSDLAEIQLSAKKNLSTKLKEMQQSDMEKFSNANGIDDLQRIAKGFEADFKNNIEFLFGGVLKEAQDEIGELKEKYNKNISLSIKKYAQTDSILSEATFDAGWLSKINNKIVWLIDMVATMILIPGGSVMFEVALRLLAEVMPLIKNITPKELIKRFITSNLSGKYNDALDELKTILNLEIDKCFSIASAEIERSLKKAAEDQKEMFEASVDRANTSRDSERSKLLEGAICQLEALKS